MSWLTDTIGPTRVESSLHEANRGRLLRTLSMEESPSATGESEIRAVAGILELQVFDLLALNAAEEEVRKASEQAYQLLRVLPLPDAPEEAAVWQLRISCVALLGDRGADARRTLATAIPTLDLDDTDWGRRVWATTLDTWLRLIRKDGWEDLDKIQSNVVGLRKCQAEFEPVFLKGVATQKATATAFSLMAQYHLAKAAEILAFFVGQGTGPDGHFDVRQQLEAQFDRAVSACGVGGLVELEPLVRLLARASATIVEASIWTVTRAVNSRVTDFVEHLASRDRPEPIFEMLPPQRRTLREAGLLGSAKRSVVVSLPTSSGKTLIAQFRILQALNQFETERGWVAYLAPTRALVKQISIRLRNDFEPLGIGVQRVSPALEVDGMEAALLTDADPSSQFRVLVTTPEKLDLMIRSGWEEEIGRPLTLIVVDEAHNIASGSRGIKLELLLATINRECGRSQFLLLTPFIQNASEIAKWLSPDSSESIEFAVNWRPNDRVVALASPIRGEKRGSFTVGLETLHTTKQTISIAEDLRLPEERPLGLSYSSAKAQGALAAATAEQLKERGTVIVIASTPRNCWALARKFATDQNRRDELHISVTIARDFLADEYGDSFELVELLAFGVGVHHAGMSDEARALIEWLTEEKLLDVLVATTTLAQGVNFPVSGVVLASHQYPYGVDMTTEEFWNLAGRAGRVDQGEVGVIALAAGTDEKKEKLRAFVSKSVSELNSTLVDMVLSANETGRLLALETLSHEHEWSAFLQYLVHTYRQIGDPMRFSQEIELVLRGTLGFQELRRTHTQVAAAFVTGVGNYAMRLAGKPLSLVDSTGFSLESVVATLARIRDTEVTKQSWTPEIFDHPSQIKEMMGLLLQVPELRENLLTAAGPSHDGDRLARIVCDWVQGMSLQEMASTHFPTPEQNDTNSMTDCCRVLFSKLTQTASWGLAALQALTFQSGFEDLSEAELRSLRNLPARVYYGVNSDEALTLRLLGVPRKAATPMAGAMQLASDTSLTEVRQRIAAAGDSLWREAMGDLGPTYRTVWEIIEGI